ncbi:hypothetical protein ACMGE9_01010 [Macrococcus sp. EM39E]|uniref:hypothetical protein n=1 Tax=Macrococcus animalis TaxID=3395467 RepID=UPI0039BDF200
MKHTMIDDKLAHDLFNQFITKLSPLGYYVFGLNQLKRLNGKRYQFKDNIDYYSKIFKDEDKYYNNKLLILLMTCFPNESIYALSYHTESFQVEYNPDLHVEYPLYPSGDDVLYVFDEFNQIYIPSYGDTFYVTGEKIINVIDDFIQSYSFESFELSDYRINFQYFKGKDEEEQGPVVDLKLYADERLIEHFEIFEDYFAKIDYLIKKVHSRYAIYGVTELNPKKLEKLKYLIRDSHFNEDEIAIINELYEILNTFNLTELVIGGV